MQQVDRVGTRLQQLCLQPVTQSLSVCQSLADLIYGDQSLVGWFDRNLHYNASNAPSGSPDYFPRIVTSCSQNMTGGGILVQKQTINELIIDAVEL